MRRFTFVYIPKKRTSYLHHFKKRKIPFKKMMSVDVPLDQLFLKILAVLFLLCIPYTGIIMFLYFIK